MNRGMTWKDGLAKKLGETCKHYNGAVNQACKAGVEYRTAAGGETGFLRRLPCWLNNRWSQDGDVIAQCNHRQFPSGEEIELRILQTERSFQNNNRAKEAIIDFLDQHDLSHPGSQGSMPCPICNDGTLGWSIAASNGHWHVHCTTPGCASWIE